MRISLMTTINLNFGVQKATGTKRRCFPFREPTRSKCRVFSTIPAYLDSQLTVLCADQKHSEETKFQRDFRNLSFPKIGILFVSFQLTVNLVILASHWLSLTPHDPSISFSAQHRSALVRDLLRDFSFSICVHAAKGLWLSSQREPRSCPTATGGTAARRPGRGA